MIYICIPSHDNAATVGLLLWKVRQVLAAFPREYQLLVADDGSTDATGEVLSSYGRVLPMSVTKHPVSRGYAVTVEELLRQAMRPCWPVWCVYLPSDPWPPRFFR